MNIESMRVRSYRSFKVDDQIPEGAAERYRTLKAYWRLREAGCGEYGSKARRVGELVQVDHMTYACDGRTLKEFRAVCPVSRFMVTRVYSRATAGNARRFLMDLLGTLPFPQPVQLAKGFSDERILGHTRFRPTPVADLPEATSKCWPRPDEATRRQHRCRFVSLGSWAGGSGHREPGHRGSMPMCRK